MELQQTRLLTFDQPLTDWDILRVFYAEHPMTRRDVADALGRAKSPTLVTRLNRMASEGLFKVEYYTLPNGVDMWVYTITEKALKIRDELEDRMVSRAVASERP